MNTMAHLTGTVVIEHCVSCKQGSKKDGSSFCEKESCYSYLSHCIRQKALDEFLVVHATHLKAPDANFFQERSFEK